MNKITLRELRISRQRSVEEVSTCIKVPVGKIEYWEDGTIIPDASEAIRLSEFYGCSLQEVYGAIINTPAPKVIG